METTALSPGGAYRIRCGWCGHIAEPPRCDYCGRDPELPWAQRGAPPPVVAPEAAGRPTLDAEAVRRRLADAREALGTGATQEAIAEFLGVSVRTVARWQKVAS